MGFFSLKKAAIVNITNNTAKELVKNIEEIVLNVSEAADKTMMRVSNNIVKSQILQSVGLNTTEKTVAKVEHFFSVFLFLIVLGATTVYSRIPAEKKENLYKKFLEKLTVIETKTKLPFVIAGWFALRFFYNVGWFLFLEIFIFAAMLNYCVVRYFRNSRNVTYKANQALLLPGVLKSVLQEDVPPWVSFPNVERVDWINQIVAGLWTEIAASTEATIADVLGDVFEENKPPFLTSLGLTRCRLGSVPPVIDGVEVFPGKNETSIDFHVSWIGDPDIRVDASTVIGVEAVVTNLQFRAILRVTAGPFTDKIPCISCISISFIGKPDIDFELCAAKVNLDYIPGLGSWLDNFLRYTLTGLMSYPKRIVIPIEPGFDVSQYSNRADPIGILTITVKRCRNLPKNKFSSLSPFLQVYIVGDDKKEKCPSKSGTDPVFNAVFHFSIYDKNTQIHLDVFDESTLKSIKIGPLGVAQSMIGRAAIYVNTIMDKGSYVTTDKLFNPDKDIKKTKGEHPTIEYTCNYISMQSKDDKKTGSPLVQMSDEQISNCNNALLWVTVLKCSGLASLPNPMKTAYYASVSTAEVKQKTADVKVHNDPVFDDRLELRCNNPLKSILRVKVKARVAVGVLKVVGTAEIPVSDILRSGGQVNKDYSLKPQGRIHLKINAWSS